MDQALLDDIKGAGHWRINFRPTAPLAEKLSIKLCREAVSTSNVELRGWDYPHVLLRQDEHSGYANGENFFEAWTSFMTHREFWRMYQSGQFLHYRAMWEDREEHHGLPERPFLSVEGVIYLFTEIGEFSKRLISALAMPGGFDISVEARQTYGRRLWVGRNRMPFFEPKTTTAESVVINGQMAASGSENPQQVALQMCRDFFDRFGWNPPDDQIQADQVRLLKRQF